ncbi:hypothetical protein ABIA35_006902 [Catenulispora sp. MAP12-49]|uniref:DUF262 domain-containing protein n=1 Tax=Catenulispora sp. MAP12-49 TaxID=3156302 RepID=UPI0035193D90
MSDVNALFDMEDHGEDDDVTADQHDALVVPLGERRLVTQPYDLSLATLVSDIEKGQLLLNVAYQRKYVWDRAKASRLIESFLLNIPVPVCYFAENDDGTYEVIDGAQRVTSVNDFLSNKFRLRGVPVMSELEGKRYDELSPKDARRLASRTIRCVVITADSHPDIKFDVFERLNTGSATLHEQELRNCIYRGAFNSFLKNVADLHSFERILGGIKNSRMAYEELALRFFALYDGISDYKPPLRQCLNQYMRSHRTSTPSKGTVKVFDETCDTVYEIFGADAFKLVRGGQDTAFNRALFDAVMLPLAFADRRIAVERSTGVRDLRDRLLTDSEFLADIGRATADRARMHGRVKSFADGLIALGVPCRLPSLADG